MEAQLFNYPEIERPQSNELRITISDVTKTFQISNNVHKFLQLIRNIFVEYFSPVAWLGCCYQLTVVEERLGKLRQWRPESSLPSQHCVTLALIYLVLPPLMITIMIITNFNKTFPQYRIVFHRSCFVQTKLGVYCTIIRNCSS